MNWYSAKNKVDVYPWRWKHVHDHIIYWKKQVAINVESDFISDKRNSARPYMWMCAFMYLQLQAHKNTLEMLRPVTAVALR